MRRFRIAQWLVFFALLSVAGNGRADIIIDDSDGGPQFTTVGSWNYRDEVSKPQSYDGNGSVFAFHDADPVAVATYTPDLPEAGLWKVEMWWPHWYWTDNAPVEVAHTGGTYSKRIDQYLNGNSQWHKIGLFDFDTGTTGTLSISSEGTNSGSSNVGPVADAARFTYLGGVIQPAAAAASSEIDSHNRFKEQAINGSGMSDADGDGYLDTHVTGSWGEDSAWMSNSGDTTGWYAVDLGRQHWLEAMEFFNFNAIGTSATRGVKTADIYISTLDDPGIASPDFSDTSVWQLWSDDLELTIAPGTSDYNTPDLIDFDGELVRWVAIDIIENHGYSTFVGISELQFYGMQVPEPASGALAVLGISGLGLFGRRSRRRGGGRVGC